MSPSNTIPTEIFDDLVSSVPKIIDRTARQIRFTQALLGQTPIGQIPCVGSLVQLLPSPRISEPSAATPNATEAQGRQEPTRSAIRVATPSATEAVAGATKVTGDPLVDPTNPKVATNGSSPLTAAEPTEGDLAIPEYDSLAASQVIPRLEMLGDNELTLILTYEEHRRNRQTIIHKIHQLLAG